MRLPTREVPQADTFQFVLRTVDLVAQDISKFQGIAANLGVDERQGRYYRLAAEILGFIRQVPRRNHAVLTDAGKRFVAGTPAQRTEMAAAAVLHARIMQRIISFLEIKGSRGASRKEIEQFITSVTRTTPGMVRRRFSTIISWLTDIGVLKEKDGRYVLDNQLPEEITTVEYEAEDEPLSPQKPDLKTYQNVSRRAKEASGYLSVIVNEAARERANDAHRMLTDLVARKIKAAGAIPKYNRYIDMSTVLDGTPYLFEMKSTRDTNAHDQVRRAVSQLYEYRYLQDVPEAKLVVVIENPLPAEKTWLLDYVVKDRQMLIAWDGDRRSLHYPPDLTSNLGFLR